MFTRKACVAFCIVLICFVSAATAQTTARIPFKNLNVADGLPQSFISGLVQDSTGFIWIGTRDGVARYDGRKFKVFRHVPGDTSTLANNTVSNLFLDRHNRLWICYETGDIDVLYTTTEKLFHFTKDAVFIAAFGALKDRHAITEDAGGNICMLSMKGIFFCNFERHALRFYSSEQLGLINNPIASFATYGSELVLLTDTALVILNSQKKITQVVPYPFIRPRLYNPLWTFKSTYCLVRPTGEIIMLDGDRVIIFNLKKKLFTVRLMPAANRSDINCFAQDTAGNLMLNCKADIYVLPLNNELQMWKQNTDNRALPAVCMLLDQSGVLWVGGNGNGIQNFDLRLPRLTGSPYEKNFHEDVLTKMLRIPSYEINNTYLHNMHPYRLRWVKGSDDKIWISEGGNEQTVTADVCYVDKGHLVFPPWHYTDSSVKTHIQINGMAFSASGKLWGIDYFLRPVYFNTQTHAVTVYRSVAPVIYSSAFTVNSLLMEGEETFWISTSLKGLYRYNKRTGETIHYTQHDSPGSLPTNQLMNLVNDPYADTIMWMGTLGSGLVKFNKVTGKCRIYTTGDGLPNNTIYAVIAAGNKLWCSSNKGLFSFDLQTEKVQSYTSKDGLLGDEFNRFHYLQLPDNRIAFGGVDGYTVINPVQMPDDDFRPVTAITNFGIANVPADAGYAGSPLHQAINSLQEMVLPYYQNFLTFEFAALEFNITEKLQYRYRLQGFDDKWITTGTDNIATYTNIPPGNYTLKINATNTAGKWSSYVKVLHIIIRPPFWKTWWFISLCVAAAGGLIYLFIKERIAVVRKEEQQKRHFEREAMELKAQALRAQMNPHFIFNCLNSIKALIQEDSKKQAIIYLTTFSKLIRNQLNSAQQEVSLHEELETCKLYVQLESLRFGSKVVYEFTTDENVDTHSFKVPPLILQPFIENAIWHGILPKEGGKVTVTVRPQPNGVQCTIDDNGIGRETSLLNKAQNTPTYQSKGMKLVQSRLQCYNVINNQRYSIEVIDKKDPASKPAGTMVIVNFKKEV